MNEVEQKEQLAKLKALIEVNEEIIEKMKHTLIEIRATLDRGERHHRHGDASGGYLSA
jgi:hypothetical protein